MNITKENINKLIEERKQTYNKIDDVVSAFNGENQISNDYNGRQILEIIQNADDAQAKRIDISIDTNKHILTIYNDGKPFSYEGIKSIMIANASSKVMSSYIGNKGLGFRSLIFWAHKIQIHTGAFIFTFSRNEAAKFAEELNINLDEIRWSRNLAPTCIPFPMLAIPNVEYLEDGLGKGCKVVIEYKKNYEKNIIEQLNQIEEKALLFLNNVTEMNISGTSMNEKKLSIKHEGNNRYLADGIYWLKETLSEELPEEFQDSNKLEKQRYSIQLAIPEDRNTVSNCYCLYNYLPTQESIGLPFIIHATLELNSSRNYIIEKEVNRYILQKVAEFISKYIDRKLGEDNECDWKWYQMITPLEQFSNTSQIIKENLFSTLKKERDSKSLFPTVCGKYVGINNYYYSSKEELEFWDDFQEKKGEIKYVLRPFDDNITLEKRLIKQEDYIHSLNSISSAKNLNINTRAKLINFVIRNVSINESYKLWLFIDDNNNLINDERAAVFTPKTEGTDYPCPSFVNIQFINRELYICLLELLRKNDFLWIDSQSANQTTTQSRTFCALLKKKNIASVNDYDKSEVLRAIVSQTNKYITTQDKNVATKAIKEMFFCLLKIYVSLGYETNLESVKLLDTDGGIVDASKLLLDTSDNRHIFGDNASYILAYDSWNIDKLDKPGEPEYTRFLKLLGVNRFIKEDKVKDIWIYAQWLEKMHILNACSNTTYTIDNMLKVMYETSLIKMTDLLSKSINEMTLDKIIYLLATNEELLNCVVNSRETLSFKYTRIYHLETEYSYLRFQFLQLASVNKKILSSDIVLGKLNSNTYLQDIPSEKMNSIMKFLTTNLRGLDDNEITDILNKLSDEKNRKYVRRVYSLVIDALNKDGRNLNNHNVRLCAYSGDGKVIFLPASKVYYTDNTSIPKALESSIGRNRLYYPARRGAKKVCDTLGIEPLAEFYPIVQNNSIKEHPLNHEFMSFIEGIKLYILLYCIQNVDSYDVKKDLASRLKNLRIKLVYACHYQLNGNIDIELNPIEFINSNGIFYLNANGVNYLSEMQSSVKYCKAISEILSIETKLEGKDEVFERIFQNPRFMKDAAEYDFADDIQEAKELMGISREELSFWNFIRNSNITDINDVFYKSIIKEFGLPDDFHFERVDFRKWMTIESKELLRNIYSKNLRPNNIDLSFLHKKEFDDIKSTYRLSFVHSLWLCLCSDIKNQKNFIKYQKDYENIYFEGDKSKLYEDNEYIDYLKEKVKNIYAITWSDSSEKHISLYNIEKLNELSIEDQSIFFFPNNQDKVNKIITQLETKTEEDNDSNDGSSATEKEIKSITFLDGKDIKKGNLPVNKNMKSNSEKGSVYTSETDRKKKKAGKNAELTVRNVLKAGGFDFYWLSGNSDESNKDDTLGYDFKYKVKGESEWRYLEVKKFNGESFILSKNEYNTALDERYKNQYDLALVYDDNVYIIKNFFKNDNFSMEAESFSVYCKIE